MALIYLDTCVFIAGFEANRATNEPVRRIFDTLAGRPPRIAATSELTIVNCSRRLPDPAFSRST